MIRICFENRKLIARQRVACGQASCCCLCWGFAGTNEGCDGDCKSRLLGNQWAINWQSRGNAATAVSIAAATMGKAICNCIACAMDAAVYPEVTCVQLCSPV